jgi:hypothetical protein
LEELLKLDIDHHNKIKWKIKVFKNYAEDKLDYNLRAESKNININGQLECKKDITVKLWKKLYKIKMHLLKCNKKLQKIKKYIWK